MTQRERFLTLMHFGTVDRVQFSKDLYARIFATHALDFVQVWEDMAYKTASLISPAPAWPCIRQ